MCILNLDYTQIIAKGRFCYWLTGLECANVNEFASLNGPLAYNRHKKSDHAFPHLEQFSITHGLGNEAVRYDKRRNPNNCIVSYSVFALTAAETKIELGLHVNVRDRTKETEGGGG